MNEIITIKRDELKTRLDEFFERVPEHIYMIDLVPSGENTIFFNYPETIYSKEHTLFIYLDDIKKKGGSVNEQVVTYDNAEIMQRFIFKIRNTKLDRPKRLIVACKTGLTVSGAVAQWAMDWLMDGDEAVFNKLNPDIKPNELLQNDLYLHPLI
jgi:predicted protein tyrosine phosphatase